MENIESMDEIREVIGELKREMSLLSVSAVNGLINAQGVYFILAVLDGASNRYGAFVRERRLFHFNNNNRPSARWRH